MARNRTLTIFTPTYNRAHTLPVLYESLKSQTSRDFVWLIVDDGSTDATQELVESWIALAEVPIRYFLTKNGGKARAHNFAVDRLDTELFLCVDSDDYLLPRAVSLLLERWTVLRADESLAGVIFLRGSDATTPIGTFMPQGYDSINSLLK